MQDKTTVDQTPTPDNESSGGGSRPRAALVVYSTDGVRVVPFSAGSRIIVGRAWPSDVVVSDLSLSRQHARFSWAEEGMEVEDLGSRNGTYVRGEPVERASLLPGDTVTLGGVTVSVNQARAAEGLLGGIDSHERLVDRVEDEIRRARTFGRKLAVGMIRALEERGGHVSHWVPRLRHELRDVDHVSLYGRNSVLVFMPETERDEAIRAIRKLVYPPREGEPTLVAGVASFPEAGSTHELIDGARRATRRASVQQPAQLAEGAQHEPASGTEVIAESPGMLQALQLARRLSSSSIPVLIHGPTGSGKEVLARVIHESGPRGDKPLKCINCGAIPASLLESELFGHERGAFTGADRTKAGLFEQAAGGTVLLDEVGELPAAAQAALLRVLETKRVTRVGGAQEIEVDVRVVAATHRDLPEMANHGEFRLDLLYRLNTVTVEVPGLAERPEDIEPLAELFLAEASRATGGHVRDIDEGARRLLKAYAWPGNVRELRNVIERAVILSRTEWITAEDLPESVRGQPAVLETVRPEATEESTPFKDRVRQYEKELILDALRRAEGNQTHAAKILQMPLRTLVHKIKQYGIRKIYDVE